MFKDLAPEIYQNENHVVPTKTCFCSKFWPIITLTQLIGINPFTVTHDKAHNNCKLHYEQWSFPNFCNWFGICFHVNCVFWSHWNSNLRTYLSNYFIGTDLYVFGFQAVIISLQVFFIILLARLRKASLAEGFNKLCQAWNEIQTLNNGNEEQRQRGTSIFWSWILVVLILVNALIYVILVVIVTFGRCVGESLANSICDLQPTFILKKAAHSLIPLYQLGACGLFATFCLLIQSLHCELGRILKFAYHDADTVDQVRRTHGKLCKATRFLSDHFGIALLCIMCTAVVTIACGSYLVIMEQEKLVTLINGQSLDVQLGFFYTRYFQVFFATLSVILILIPAQMVTNSVTSASNSLCEVRLTDLEPKAQFQVSLFLQSVKPRNSNLTACNITNLGLTFVASAVTNATTYILVLLQFRLATTGLETEKNFSSGNGTYY